MISRHLSKRQQSAFVAASLLMFLLVAAFIIFNPAVTAQTGGNSSFNYKIYKYFAQLSNAGYDIFSALPPGAPRPDDPNIVVEYLDFAPASLAIYKILFFVQDNFIPHFYFIYQVGLAAACLGLVFYAARRSFITTLQFNIALLVMALSPIWLLLTTWTGEDKAILAFFPMLLFVASRISARMFSLICGVYAGITGFAAAFFPIAAILLYFEARADGRYIGRIMVLGLSGIIAIALLALFYPDSAVMFQNRLFRGELEPFWFTIWRYAPDIYTSALGKAIIVAFALFCSLLVLLRRIAPEVAIFAIQFMFVFMDNYLVYQRYLAFAILPVVAIRNPRWLLIYAGTILFLMYALVAVRLLHIPVRDFPSEQLFEAPALAWMIGTNLPIMIYFSFLFYAMWHGDASRDPVRPAA